MMITQSNEEVRIHNLRQPLEYDDVGYNMEEVQLNTCGNERYLSPRYQMLAETASLNITRGSIKELMIHR